MAEPATRLAGTRFASLWHCEPELDATTASLQGACSTDLLIVGAGFTGLWAALCALQANPSRAVTIIEASHVAAGASGRPGAIVSTSVMHGLANAVRLYPEDIGALETLGQENMRGFRQALVDYGIDCDPHWGGELTVAIGEEALPAIREEYDLQRRYGHDVTLLDGQGVRSQLDSPLFSGGVWATSQCGTVHPGKLASGLRDAVLALGATLFENTPLTGVRRRGGRIEVATPEGVVSANRVLLATNAFAAGERRIRHRVVMVRDRVLATAPLTDTQLARIGWRERQGVYDTRTQLNYMRLTRDNRIVFGGRLGYGWDAGMPATDRTAAPYERLAQAFARTFPQLDDVPFDFAWSGPIAMTTRMAVHFQRYLDGAMVFAGGYSGFGVSASRFGARLALALLDDEPDPALELSFARTMPGWIPPEPFRGLGARLTMHALDTHDERGGWRGPWLRLVERLGFPLS
ncbi:MAG: FAD-dependent oxidoreductase [Pseudomonadota bacterium]